jgi:hypothetical protein
MSDGHLSVVEVVDHMHTPLNGVAKGTEAHLLCTLQRLVSLGRSADVSGHDELLPRNLDVDLAGEGQGGGKSSNTVCSAII